MGGAVHACARPFVRSGRLRALPCCKAEQGGTTYAITRVEVHGEAAARGRRRRHAALVDRAATGGDVRRAERAIERARRAYVSHRPPRM